MFMQENSILEITYEEEHDQPPILKRKHDEDDPHEENQPMTKNKCNLLDDDDELEKKLEKETVKYNKL